MPISRSQRSVRTRPARPNIRLPSRHRSRTQPFRQGLITFPLELQRPIPRSANTWTWFSVGNSSYNSLQVDLNHRFSHDLSLRGVYTYSKALDDGDSLNATTAGNAPALASNPYNLQRRLGPSDVQRHKHRCNQCYLRVALRARQTLRKRSVRFGQRLRRGMVCNQHRHTAVRIPALHRSSATTPQTTEIPAIR